MSSAVSTSAAAAEMKEAGAGPDYSEAVIYFLRSDLDPRIYIGSTTNPMKRESDHWNAAHYGEDSKLYRAMREIGIYSYYMEIVEDYPCSSFDELLRREMSYTEEAPASILLNTNVKYGELSEEHRQRLRDAWTDERKSELSKQSAARWDDPEHRKKMSELQKQRWTDPEYRAKMSNHHNELWKDPAHRAAASARSRAVWADDEFRARMGEASRQAWKVPERHVKAALRVGTKAPNFKGGTCYHSKKDSNFVVRWTVDETGKRVRRSQCFSYGSRSEMTEEEAKQAAEEFKAALVFE